MLSEIGAAFADIASELSSRAVPTQPRLCDAVRGHEIAERRMSFAYAS